MTIRINDQVLRDMFELCSFTVPEDELVFVTLRGAQPIEYGGSGFGSEHKLIPTAVDFVHMRCTVLQWHTGRRELAPSWEARFRTCPASGSSAPPTASA